MAGHATTSNAGHACQARQARLVPTGIGSKYSPRNKCVFGCHNGRAAALARACSARTAAHSRPCTASGSVCQNSHLFLAKYLRQLELASSC